MAGGAGNEIRLILFSSSSSNLLTNAVSEVEVWLACLAWRRRIELTPPTALISIDFQLSRPEQGPGLTE